VEEDKGLRSIGKRHDVLQSAVHITGELYYGCGLRVDSWRRWFGALALQPSQDQQDWKPDPLPSSVCDQGHTIVIMTAAADISTTESGARCVIAEKPLQNMLGEFGCIIYCFVDSCDK
jgi:hypothetical protein